MERQEKARMERAADALFLFSDYVDGFRSGTMPRKPRELNAGDRVRVIGRVPFTGMETGKVYEVHLTATERGVPTVTFRLVDSADRASKHSVGPFRAASVHAMLKTDESGPGGGLFIERIAPIDLGG
jgi:hypothetical protein